MPLKLLFWSCFSTLSLKALLQWQTEEWGKRRISTFEKSDGDFLLYLGSKPSENLKSHGLMNYTERIKKIKKTVITTQYARMHSTHMELQDYSVENEMLAPFPSCSACLAVYCHGFLPSGCPCSLALPAFNT